MPRPLRFQCAKCQAHYEVPPLPENFHNNLYYCPVDGQLLGGWTWTAAGAEELLKKWEGK